jgi:hypothetical protein
MLTLGKYGKISMRDFAARFKDPFLREVFPFIIEDLPGMSMTGVLLVQLGNPPAAQVVMS